MLRAIQSAEIVNKSFSYKDKTLLQLREFSIGGLQGQPRANYYKLIAEAKANSAYNTLEEMHAFTLPSGIYEDGVHEGESVNKVYERAKVALRKIAQYAQKHKDDAELAIMHEWWSNSLLAKKLGLDRERIKIENAGIVCLKLTLTESDIEIEILAEKCRKCFVDSIQLNDWLKQQPAL